MTKQSNKGYVCFIFMLKQKVWTKLLKLSQKTVLSTLLMCWIAQNGSDRSKHQASKLYRGTGRILIYQSSLAASSWSIRTSRRTSPQIQIGGYPVMLILRRPCRPSLFLVGQFSRRRGSLNKGSVYLSQNCSVNFSQVDLSYLR